MFCAPAEIVKHSIIPTTDHNLSHSASSTDLGSVSSQMSQSGDEGALRTSSTPVMLSDEINEALRKKGHPMSSSFEFLGTGREPSSPQKQNLSAKEVELSMIASPAKEDGEDSAPKEEDQGPPTGQPAVAAPPLPSSPPPDLDQEPGPPTEPPPAVPEGDSDRPSSSVSSDNLALPPAPSSAPPHDDDSDEPAPPLPSSLPPTQSRKVYLSDSTNTQAYSDGVGTTPTYVLVKCKNGRTSVNNLFC